MQKDSTSIRTDSLSMNLFHNACVEMLCVEKNTGVLLNCIFHIFIGESSKYLEFIN